MDPEERRCYIGASDAAAVLGLSRWTTPLAVWAEKTGKVEPEDVSEKLAIWLGNELEETVAKLFELKTGKKVHKVIEPHIHPVHPFLVCHIDRKVEGESAVLQCKTASPRKSKEWEGEEIPIEYIIQEQHEMMVTGYQHAYIAVLIGNEQFVWKEIKRDEGIIRDIMAREVYFWNTFVAARVMPEIILKGDNETLRRLYPSAVPLKSIQLNEAGCVIAEGIKNLKDDVEKLDEIIKQQEAELKKILGDAEFAESKTFKVTWKNQAQRRVDTDKLQINFPDVYE